MSFHKFKEINPRSLANDIRTELESHPITASQDNIITAYNNAVINALNKDTPQRQKQVKVTHKQLWFNENIKREIISRWKKEHTWEQEQTEYSFKAFYYKRRYVANIITSAQRHFYHGKTAKNSADFKAIFQYYKSPLTQIPGTAASTIQQQTSTHKWIQRILHHQNW